MTKKSKKDLLLCEIKARRLQIMRHIPKLDSYAKAKQYGSEPIMTTEEGRKLLIDAVKTNMPFMAARFGTSEGAALYEYWKKKLFNGEYSNKYLDQICTLSGFFPNSKEKIFKWAELETDACSNLDLLGCMNFVGEEWICKTFCANSKLMPAGGLASASKGWAWVLEGKKVLVIHPFTDTIQSQYNNNRERIFPGTNALPLFDLKCIKAVQTIADATDNRFSDWFEALDYMTEEILKQDFEIALLGCGAYGFP